MQLQPNTRLKREEQQISSDSSSVELQVNGLESTVLLLQVIFVCVGYLCCLVLLHGECMAHGLL